RLRDEDVAQRVPPGERERLCRLRLPGRDGLQRGADDLAGVGGHAEPDGDPRRGQPVEGDPHVREAVVDELEQHDHRGAAADLHDDDRRPGHPAAARGGEQGEPQPEDEAGADAHPGELEGDDQAAEQLEEVVRAHRATCARIRWSRYRESSATGTLSAMYRTTAAPKESSPWPVARASATVK